MGVAFDVSDAETAVLGVVSGRNFEVRLISAECMPLEDRDDIETEGRLRCQEAPEPILPGFETYDPPRLALVVRDFQAGDEENLLLWDGESGA